jgi:hypothetical protein
MYGENEFGDGDGGGSDVYIERCRNPYKRDLGVTFA